MSTELQSLTKPLPDVLTRAEQLPSLPAVALEVLQLTQKEDTSFEDLADAISRDPALSAKLLKLSNSAMFNLGYAVTSIQQAGVILGMKTVKLMSLSFSLAGSVGRGTGDDSFDYSGYWRRSLVEAVAARSFALDMKLPSGDEAFLCGLLSRIGQLVMSQCMPDEYARVTEACQGDYPTWTAELETLGFHHGDVGGALLKSWELPESVYLPVAYQYDPDELPAGSPRVAGTLAGILEIANLASSLLCEDSIDSISGLYEQASRRFGMERDQVDDFLLGLESQVAETAAILDVDMASSRSHEEILREAQQRLLAVSLGTAMDLHQAEQKAVELESQNQELSTKASTDTLTGLPNRAAFDAALEQEVHKRLSGKVTQALGLLVIDIDHFRNFNNDYGHQAGDAVLVRVGEVLKNATRSSDLPSRWGGEEFAIILRQTTPVGARVLGERIRRAIEQEVVEYEGEQLKITISLGGAWATSVRSPSDGKKLLKVADTLLYKAKDNGRNRCECME